MSEPTDPVLLERDGAVVCVRFNRPAFLNAIDDTLADAFLAACREISGASGIRAIVLAGAGKAFMAGGDLGCFHADLAAAPDIAHRLIRPLHEGVGLLTALPQPVIAAVHGAVAGAGLGVALASDFAIAAQGTRFSVAYLRAGVSADAGVSWSLPRMVGLRRALELAFLTGSFDAAEALRLGLVNRVVPQPELMEQTMALAHRLASGPTAAYGRMKALMRESFDRTFAEQLEAEREGVHNMAATEDFAEGIRAFVAKQTPKFTGR